jgi:hypothetical protein
MKEIKIEFLKQCIVRLVTEEKFEENSLDQDYTLKMNDSVSKLNSTNKEIVQSNSSKYPVNVNLFSNQQSIEMSQNSILYVYTLSELWSIDRDLLVLIHISTLLLESFGSNDAEVENMMSQVIFLYYLLVS